MKNTGTREGAEVVQVYIAAPMLRAATAARVKGLRQSSASSLAKAARWRFVLRPTALAFYDGASQKWKAEAGEYQVQLGTSSRDIRLKSSVKLAADQSFDRF